jgi:hypothetical protein
MRRLIPMCPGRSLGIGRLKSGAPFWRRSRLHSVLRPGSYAEIGFVKAFVIQIREARREGLHASAVLNAKSFATSEYSQLVKRLGWRKRVRKKFEPRSVDLLILDRIELRPEYRGHGLRLVAARCLIEMFGSRCGLVACKPYPLQFEGSNRWRPPGRPRVRQKCCTLPERSCDSIGSV